MRHAVFRLIQEHSPGTFRKIQNQGMGKTFAKVDNAGRTHKKGEFPLDRVSGKRARGRPAKIPPSWVRGRADNYRSILAQVWNHISPGLSKAETRQDVVNSFSGSEVGAYSLEFVTLADLILKVVRDPKFPKRKREAQINFLADSIAGYGMFTPRSSRDICERERARIERVHRILSYEFYIECSCGYLGHSRNHACPMCEAEIHFREHDSPLDIG
jgi:hypothetical protein